MLISENMLVPPTKVLEGIKYIEESYSPAMIPVTENSRLDKYVVSLEDINSYCENTSADPGYIVSQICETNNIPVDDIAFSVTQESIILQDEVAKNAIYLMNEGAEVLAKPVVHDALYDVLEEDCARIYQGLDPVFLNEVTTGYLAKKLGLDTKYDNSYEDPHIYNMNEKEWNQYMGGRASNSELKELLTIKKMGGFKQHMQSRKAHKGRLKYAIVYNEIDKDRLAHMGHVGRERAQKQKELEQQKKQIEQKQAEENKRQEDLNQPAQNISKDTDTKIKRLQQQAQRSNNRGFIAKIIARLNAIARKYREKYKTVKVSGPKTAIQRVIAFISKCVASLTAKLHSLTR